MLFDPKWEVETKSDPFSLESLIAWLEKQPADRAYDYCCNGHCLLAQYFTAAGFQSVVMFSWRFEHQFGTHKLPPYFNAIAIDDPATFNWPFEKDNAARTFGAALARARKALSA